MIKYLLVLLILLPIPLVITPIVVYGQCGQEIGCFIPESGGRIYTCYQDGYNDALRNPELNYPYSLKAHAACEQFSSTGALSGDIANPYMRGFVNACEHTAHTSLDRAENRANCEAFAKSKVLQDQQREEKVSLMHQATPINTAGKQSSLSHQIKVWVNAPSPELLSNIQKVVYHLHPTFNPSEMTSDKPDDNFALSLNVWGQFELKATVYFKDGTTIDISRYLSFSSLD
jgi:hypothetical protein